MDYKRIALAAVVAWVVDNLYGMVVWMRLMGPELANYPAVFRPQADMMANMPMMFAGGLLAMFALAYIYAKGYEGGSGVAEGFRFGAVMAMFNLGFFSIGIYGTFNIGGRLAAVGAVVGIIEMILVGLVIGALYRPAVQRARVAATA
jgi:hypothetical protein